MTRRPESVLVVVHSADRVLLLERLGWPGFWQSVTGSVRLGESPEQAARRELQEETGLELTVSSLDCQHEFRIAPHRRGEWAPGTILNCEYAFHCALHETLPVVIDAAEHADWGWFPRRTARWLASSWTNRAALERLPGTPDA